jgi:nucleoside triphosphate pyrophosphatase
MQRLLLGSSSPRRQAILSHFSLPFDVATPLFDEDSIPFEGDPATYVRRLAEGKADSLVDAYPERPLVTADTMVFTNGKIYGKPSTRDEAFSVLDELAGVWHTVYTAVCARRNGEGAIEVARTEVLLRQLTADQIYRYIDAVGSGDKAAGYAVQGTGYMIIKGIEGCFYNAMGLPIGALTNVLRHIGIDLWDFLGRS